MKNTSMFYGATPNTFKKAKMLRAKMTSEEKVLWEKLKNQILKKKKNGEGNIQYIFM